MRASIELVGEDVKGWPWWPITKACNYFIFFYSLLMSPRTIPCLLVPEEQKLRKLFRGGGGRLATKGALLHGLPRPLLGPSHRNCVSYVRVLPRSHINKRSSFVAPNCCLDVIAPSACLCDYVLTCLLACLCHLSMPCCLPCALLCM